MHRNTQESLHQAEHYEEIERDMFLNTPSYKRTLSTYVFTYHLPLRGLTPSISSHYRGRATFLKEENRNSASLYRTDVNYIRNKAENPPERDSLPYYRCIEEVNQLCTTVPISFPLITF